MSISPLTEHDEDPGLGHIRKSPSRRSGRTCKPPQFDRARGSGLLARLGRTPRPDRLNKAWDACVSDGSVCARLQDKRRRRCESNIGSPARRGGDDYRVQAIDIDRDLDCKIGRSVPRCSSTIMEPYSGFSIALEETLESADCLISAYSESVRQTSTQALSSNAPDQRSSTLRPLVRFGLDQSAWRPTLSRDTIKLRFERVKLRFSLPPLALRAAGQLQVSPCCSDPQFSMDIYRASSCALDQPNCNRLFQPIRPRQKFTPPGGRSGWWLEVGHINLP